MKALIGFLLLAVIAAAEPVKSAWAEYVGSVEADEVRWRDRFGRQELNPRWELLKPPTAKWWSTGWGLELEPVSKGFGSETELAFVGYRIGHRRFTFTVQVEVPRDSRLKMGLVLFDKAGNSHRFAVWRGPRGGIEFVQKSSSSGPAAHWETETALPVLSVLSYSSEGHKPPEKVWLRMEADENHYEFSYSANQGETWIELERGRATRETGMLNPLGGMVGPFVERSY